MHRFSTALVVALALGACDRKPLPKAGDLQGEVTALVPKVEEAAGLTFKTPPTVASQSSEEVQKFLIAQFERPEIRRDLDFKIGVWKRLGVVPDTVDVVALLTRLLSEQVVGSTIPSARRCSWWKVALVWSVRPSFATS